MSSLELASETMPSLSLFTPPTIGVENTKHFKRFSLPRGFSFRVALPYNERCWASHVELGHPWS